jgi:phosphate transport system permease protein
MFEQAAHAPIATVTLLALAGVAFVAFFAGRGRAMSYAADTPLHSLANYHGQYLAIWATAPALVLLGLFAGLGGRISDTIVRAGLVGPVAEMPSFRIEAFIDAAREIAYGRNASIVPGDPLYEAARVAANQVLVADGMIKLIVVGLAALMVLAAAAIVYTRLKPAFRARNRVESALSVALIFSSGIAVATTLGIVLSLVFETFRFFQDVSPLEFLFGLQWSAQTSIRPDQIGSSGAFGAVPLFFGTLMISSIAMLVAVPVGLFSAIYLSEYAGPRTRQVVKPMLEVLAGVPTVVYGFFALLTVAPAIRSLGEGINALLAMLMPWVEGPFFEVQPSSALAAGLVMGIMIIPFVSSLSDDVINAVPQSLRDGSLAMGATRSETVRNVVLPAALPGIVGAILLAVSRAVGETMIVVMAAGQRAQITPNPFSDVTTITVQIVDLLTGDTEFDSPKTLSAFALGFVLFMVTLCFNLIALRVVQKFREKYD